MRHRIERLLPRICEPFGVVHAHEQRAEQPRAVGNGNGVDVLPAASRVLKRLRHDVVYGKGVVAAGDLRDDSAEPAMDLDLRRNDVGQHPPAVFDDGGGGFVTA